MTSRLLPSARLAGSITAAYLLVCSPVARAADQSADPTGEIADLRARLKAQRDQIDAQKRQLEAQDAQLREQEKRLDELATRSGGGKPETPAAASAPAPSNAPVLAKPDAGQPGAGALPQSPPQQAAVASPTLPTVNSRFDDIKITMGGSLRTTVNTTTARMQPDATPFFVFPKINGVSEGTTKIDARLSSLFFSIEGAQVGDFKLGGSIYAYLFNGDLLSGLYGFYPGFAYVDATSERWRFAAGLQMDVFSPTMPTMVDRMSALAGSGNAGNSFKPQIRAEHTVPMGRDRIVVQGALSDAIASNFKPPTNTTVSNTPTELLIVTENTGVPNIEARVAWIRGRPGEDGSWVPWPEYTVGLSGVSGKIRNFTVNSQFSASSVYNTRINGVSLEASARIGRQFGIQGELYTGQALGQYLATVFQTTNGYHQAIPGHGGWGEMAWYWTPTWHSHVGMGIDTANAAYISPTGFVSNRTAFLNLFWDPSPKTTLAVEGTWRRTVYGGLGENSGYSLMLSSELRF
jgi:hypothetical protein